MMKYKHIVFDVDGTLLDTEFAVLHSLQDTADKYLGTCIPMEKLYFALGIPGETALEELGITDVKGANKFWNDRLQEYVQHICLFEGVEDMLQALHEKGVELGIITSKTKEEFETDFVPHGVARYFGTVICVEDAPKPKPNPDPLQTYLQVNNLSADEVIYIGDTAYDSQCAHSAGVDFGLALWGCHRPENIEREYEFLQPSVIVSEYGKE